MKGARKATSSDMELSKLLVLFIVSVLLSAHSCHAHVAPVQLIRTHMQHERTAEGGAAEVAAFGAGNEVDPVDARESTQIADERSTAEGETTEGGLKETDVPGASSETVSTGVTRDPKDEAEAKQALDDMADHLQPIFVEYQQASWIENTNHSEANSNASIDAAAKLSSEYKKEWDSVIHYYEYEDFNDETLKRRFELQATPGTAALNETDQGQLSFDVNTMTAYSLEKVCPYDNQGCNPDTEGLTIDNLEIELATNRDKDALTYYWEEWRNVAGKPTKPYFEDYVKLMNEAATAEDNGFEDAGEMWLQPYKAPNYTTENFKSDIEILWEDMKPLYERLHTYVRYRLRNSKYYEDYFGENSPIPAHILGNMWAQSWENIYDLVVPYPEVPLIDISETLNNNVDNVTEMFQYAENFFTSLGLYKMTDDFWSKSMFEAPINATAVCHPSAWDFLSVNETGPINDGDFRIKMCTDRNQEDFITIHHEMGHTQYQMAYSQVADDNTTLQPLVFRDGANPGFHEAIGDTIALSVSTPSHLEKLQNAISGGEFTTQNPDSTTQQPAVNETLRDINQLMRMALEKVAFLPYAYILDKFRWDVFAEDYGADVYNYEWWKLRVSVQGLKPPILREKDSDFDPGCKFHVANNVPYIRYFVATILQFQFHERLCEVGNIVDNVTEVYKCDIYGNPDSGAALKDLLRQGRSQPWTKQLMAFMGNGDGNMTSESILNYFAPLDLFLQEQITKHELKVGWDDDVDKYFVQHIPATVPIVVGVVLCVMIVVVVVAYFVGKNRNENKNKNSTAQPMDILVIKSTETNDNKGFEMNEKKSISSNDS